MGVVCAACVLDVGAADLSVCRLHSFFHGTHPLAPRAVHVVSWADKGHVEVAGALGRDARDLGGIGVEYFGDVRERGPMNRYLCAAIPGKLANSSTASLLSTHPPLRHEAPDLGVRERAGEGAYLVRVLQLL